MRRNATDVQPFSIGLMYGLSLMIFNMGLYWLSDSKTAFNFGANESTNIFYISGYCVLFVLASTVNMFAVKIDPNSSSKMHIVAGTYPLVNALLSYFILEDKLKLVFLVPGALMILCGSALVSMA
jgi:drug/metabolite transporter (DMT)-like permease